MTSKNKRKSKNPKTKMFKNESYQFTLVNSKKFKKRKIKKSQKTKKTYKKKVICQNKQSPKNFSNLISSPELA